MAGAGLLGAGNKLPETELSCTDGRWPMTDDRCTLGIWSCKAGKDDKVQNATIDR